MSAKITSLNIIRETFRLTKVKVWQTLKGEYGVLLVFTHFPSDPCTVVLCYYNDEFNIMFSLSSSVLYSINSPSSMRLHWPYSCSHMWSCLLLPRICFHVTNLILWPLVLSVNRGRWRMNDPEQLKVWYSMYASHDIDGLMFLCCKLVFINNDLSLEDNTKQCSFAKIILSC